MTPFVIFDETGRITQAGAVPESMFELQKTGGRLVLAGTGHWDTHYVSDGAITARPTSAAVLSDMVLEALPMPCTIHINDKPYPCADARAELGFTYPGTYTIRVEAFPFLDAHFEVNVP